MLIKTRKENKILLDLEKDDISSELKLTLKGKREVHGDDYIDDSFYKTEVKDMLIDIKNQFIYIQETDDTVLMKRLLDTQIVSVEEEGILQTYTDELVFKGTLKEIEEQWEQKIMVEATQEK